MVTVGEIVEFLGGGDAVEWRSSDANALIARPAPVGMAGPGEVSFCGATARDPEKLLLSAKATVLILDRRLGEFASALAHSDVGCVVRSDNARLDFGRVLRRFFAPPRPTGVHPSAVITAPAHIGSGVSIGPLCTVGEGVRIGDGSVLFGGVHVYPGVRIGRNVTIHAGAVIGADGFGYERSPVGEMERFPHLGGVLIEDEVDIGANTCVDRGSLGETRICYGARIDNLVHIAHNVHVGKHAVVIANTMVGGGTRIGDYAWVAPSASLRDRLRIGERALVGLGAVVTKDVPDGVTVLGVPARDLEAQQRLLAHWAAIAEQGEDAEG